MDPFYAGFATGVINTVVFQPMDRALYRHVVDHRPFLHKANWLHPYQGVTNAVVNRTISYGFYYPIVDFHRECSKKIFGNKNQLVNNTYTGIAVGITSGVLINPMSAIKYHAWGVDKQRLLHTAKGMWAHDGIKPFARGLQATVSRDIVFNIVYTNLQPRVKAMTADRSRLEYFLLNSVVVAGATILSGPMNYVRNQKFRTPYHVPSHPAYHILDELWRETLEKNNAKERAMYVARRLCIGWGTLRVALGMAFGQIVYDYLTGKDC